MLKGSGTVTVSFDEVEARELAGLTAEQMASLQFFDVRTPAEWGGPLGAIEAAHLRTLGEMFTSGPPRSLDPGRTVVVVCRSGVRSATAALFLSAMGFGQVYNLADGMIGWNQAGLPVVSR
jgi:rhodanese-related sulfurtransferase